MLYIYFFLLDELSSELLLNKMSSNHSTMGGASMYLRAELHWSLSKCTVRATDYYFFFNRVSSHDLRLTSWDSYSLNDDSTWRWTSQRPTRTPDTPSETSCRSFDLKRQLALPPLTCARLRSQTRRLSHTVTGSTGVTMACFYFLVWVGLVIRQSHIERQVVLFFSLLIYCFVGFSYQVNYGLKYLWSRRRRFALLMKDEIMWRTKRAAQGFNSHPFTHTHTHFSVPSPSFQWIRPYVVLCCVFVFRACVYVSEGAYYVLFSGLLL